MTSTSGIPRPFSVTDAKRAREEESRRRERSTSARNTSSTTISSGGKLDVDGGDFSVFNGGNAVVKDGGKFLVQDGGSMDITDDGSINVIGEGIDFFTQSKIKVSASLANRLADNTWIGFSYLAPGLYFNQEDTSQGATDPRVVSEDGRSVNTFSAVGLLPYGPQVGPTIVSRSSYGADTWNAGVSSQAWDDALNPGGGDGLVGIRGTSSFSTTPYSIGMLLTNHTDGPDGIPSGPAVWVSGTLEDGKLELYGREGVNVTGDFTVNGAPIVVPVMSVAGRTGDIVLAKGDVGLGNVDNTSDANKPVSTDTQTALDSKASTAAATTTTPGLMSATDKVKLNAVASTKSSYYTCTGSKPDFGAANQAISTPAYQSGASTEDLGTAAAGQITVTDAGIYSIAYSIGLFTDSTLTTTKPATGRSFLDIADGAGVAYSRTALPVAEDQATGNHAGLLLPAGAVLKFNVLQTSGGTAYYRARIWLTKHP